MLTARVAFRPLLSFDNVMKWVYSLGMKCKFCTNDAAYKKLQLCRTHYGRWRRTGDPTASVQGRRNDVKPISDRLLGNIVKLSNGCWEWTAGINQYGYGKVKFDGRTYGAHRVAWFLSNGAWPVEELDHLCHTLDRECVGGIECRHRRCINPDHLEEVSKVENIRRRDARHGTF